jgi:hypothetical protein
MQRSLAIAITAEISDNKLCIEIDLEKPMLSVFCKTWANEGVAMITFDSDMMSHWACRAHNYVFWARFRAFSLPMEMHASLQTCRR